VLSAQIAVPSLYIIDGKLTKKFHDFKEIFEEFLKKVSKEVSNIVKTTV